MSGSKPRYGEAKKKKSIWMTDNSWEILESISKDFMLTRSEFVEMIAQGRLKVVRSEEISV